MANVITLEGPTQEQSVINSFLQNFNARRAQKEQLGIQQGQLDVQRGTLDVQKQQQEHVQRLSEAKSILDGWQARMNEGDSTVQQEAQSYIAQHPEMRPYLGAAAMYHASVGQQAAGVEQGVRKSTAERVAGGGTAPNDVNMVTHGITGAWMPNEGFAQQQAIDLQNRNSTKSAPVPNLTSKIPAPVNDAVSNYESRATLAMPTSEANQKSATELQREAMSQAGQTKRTAMEQAGQTARTQMTLNPFGASGTGTGTGAASGGVPDSIVKGLASRDLDPRLIMSRKWTPDMQAQVIAAVQQIDPGFSMADYNAQYKAKQAFTSGPQAQNITSFGTALRHLKTLEQDMKKLDNSKYPDYNAIANPLARHLGDEGVQKSMSQVQKDAQAVATELARAFRGSSVIAKGEIEDWLQGINTSATPADQRGAIESAVKLLAGRIAEMKSSYQQAVGRPADIDFLKPQGRAILKSMGLLDLFGEDGMGGAPAGPAGPGQNVMPGPGTVSGSQLSPGEAWAQKYMSKAGAPH